MRCCLAAPPALGRSPPRLPSSACSPTPGASGSSSTAPSPGRPGASRGDADGDTPRPREARAEPRRLGRVLRGPPRRGLPEAEDVELLMPILLPDPVLLPLSAAALRSAAVTFNSLAASSSLLAPARSASSSLVPRPRLGSRQLLVCCDG